jgi:hypothetical protein
MRQRRETVEHPFGTMNACAPEWCRWLCSLERLTLANLSMFRSLLYGKDITPPQRPQSWK